MEENVCRVCLTESDELQTIFTSVRLEDSGSTMHLSEMICSFTCVQITLGDGLPEQICESCAEEAVQMYFFKIRCEESDTILRKRLKEKLVEGSSTEKQTIKAESVIAFESSLHESNILDDFDQNISNFDYEDSLSGEDSDQNIHLYKQNSKNEKPEKLKEFECDICHKRFTREDLLLRHKIAHAMKMRDFEHRLEDSDSESDEEPKKTEAGEVEIDGTFAIDDGVDTIILNDNECLKLSSLKCILCAYVVSNDSSLDKHYFDTHIQTIKGDKDDYLICKVCDTEIKDIRHFRKHILVKHKEEDSSQKFSCPFCYLEYSKKGNLKNHMSSHEIEATKEKVRPEEKSNEQYSCDHCYKIFPSKKNLLRHINRIKISAQKNSFKKKPHVCDICFKAFNQISNLKDHLRTHNGEKPFLCPSCGKGFNQLGNLRQHQVRHSGVKSHICTTCGHGFASKGELHAHLRKHTGARPFVCDACGNGFTTSSSLTKHKRIHSGEKPYSCEYCNMKFSRSGILSRHRRIHTGERPYVCQICNKSFTQSNDLNSHLRIHTGEKPYKCDECGQPFRQSSALRTHKKTHIEPKHQQAKQLNLKKEKGVFVEDEENILVKFENLPVPV